MSQDEPHTGQKRKATGLQTVRDAKRRAILPSRQKLPIWPRRNDICNKLRNSDVMLLTGETGSGKSTQLPQFLLDEPWCKRGIAVTQPRRVAATSLAQRVAEEMGTTLGKASPSSQVGYAVRFDVNVGRGTRVKYLTDGMLVNEMVADEWLQEYDCVIVDEVHERSMNCDLILGFLARMLSDRERLLKERGRPLKVVVMSATLDSGELRTFFEKGLRSHRPDHGSQETEQSVVLEHVQGRQYPVTISYVSRPAEDIYTEAVDRIATLHTREPLPGDMLVFLTGQEDVETVCTLLAEKATTLSAQVPALWILPLYAALGPTQQRTVFEPTPKNTRKIIVATNIAESSVTIPGIRIVIDNGLVKVKEHRSGLGLDSLLVKPISKSAAIQRKGRAGREGPGKCVRLYTEDSYLGLEQDNTPEILRSDLAGVVLTMKARGIDDVVGFPLLSPPPKGSLRVALLQLLRLGAIGEDGAIAEVGRQLARLPLPPALARVLIACASSDAKAVASKNSYIDPIASLALAAVDVIAALVSEPFFISLDNLTPSSTVTEENIAQRLEARKALYRRQGDHLTYLAALRSYCTENTNRKLWADKHLVNHRAMKAIAAVRKQLRAMLANMKLLSKATIEAAEQLEAVQGAEDSERIAWLHPSEQLIEDLIKCFVSSFSPNVARLCKDGAYRTMESNHVIRIHPASVMSGRKAEGVIYSELVFTKRNYARGVSAVQLQWYAEGCDAP